MYVTNKKAALEPFPSNVIETVVEKGFARIKQKGALTPLKVIFNCAHPDLGAYEDSVLSPGATAWVRSEMYAANWAKDVFELEGKKFILCPLDQIVLLSGPQS